VKNLLFNAGYILGRNRNPWIDYARGICIVLVVFRHVFEGLGNVGEGSYSYPWLKYINIFFFSFRMPLFFIVSGVFLGSSLLRKGIGGYISNRFNTIFYPLLVWGIIQVTLQLAFAGYVNADREAVDYLNLIIKPRRIEQFWYLNALFFVSVLYALTHWYIKFKPVQQLLMGLLMFSVAAWCRVNQLELGFLGDVLFFYVFFAIGNLVSDFITNSQSYRWFYSWRTIWVLLPVFVALQHYFTRLNLMHNDDYYVQYYRPDIYILTALVGCTFIMCVSFLLQKWNVLKGLRVLGYHSLYIYVMHLMITAGLRILFTAVFGIKNVLLLMVICLAGGLLLPVMLYNLAEKAGLWWLFAAKKRESAAPVKQDARVFFQRNVVTPRESMREK